MLRRFLLPSVILNFIAGCATVPKDAGFGDVQRLTSARTGYAVQWNGHTTDDQAVDAAVRNMLVHELTVDEVVQIALLNNQELQATYEDLGIVQADLVQAGLLQNPTLSVEKRFPGQAAEIDVFQDFLQVLLVPLRKKIAGAQFEAAKAKAANAAIEEASDTRQAYYTLQGDEQMVEMWRSVLKATQAIADAAGRIHAAGNSTDLEYDNDMTLQAQAKLGLDSAEGAVVQDRERLNVLMGLDDSQTTWKVTGLLPALPPQEPRVEGLESLAISQRLELMAGRQQIEAAARSLGLTETVRYIPALTIGGHYEHDINSEYSEGPAIEVGIPLFDQGQAAVARGKSVLMQARRRYVALGIDIHSRVRAAYGRMLVSRQRAEYYSSVVLPLDARIVEQSQLQYNGMFLGPVQLLMARQAQIEAGRDYIDSLRNYWMARCELEREVGVRLPGKPATTQPTTQPYMPVPEMNMGNMNMGNMNMGGMPDGNMPGMPRSPATQPSTAPESSEHHHGD